MKTLLGFYLFFLTFTISQAQTIVDPCFVSVPTLGSYFHSSDLVNLCHCFNNSVASDLLEWKNGSWNGTVAWSNVYLPPPEGCNVRAIWMGCRYWTADGEGFGMRLDKPLEVGKEYTFTFTYASTGACSDGAFSPLVFTDHDDPSLYRAFNVGRLKATNGWTTSSITFTATEKQQGHIWLILESFESAGIILSNCTVNNPLENVHSLQSPDTTCIGESINLQAQKGANFEYKWNTGEETSSIEATQTGTYKVDITYYSCTTTDSTSIFFEDCETRLTMPNIFTPNGDYPNEYFVPIEYNYIESGQIRIFNRWGEDIFKGDMFVGWRGQENNGKEAPTGVYYYQVDYNNEKGAHFKKKGWLTLAR